MYNILKTIRKRWAKIMKPQNMIEAVSILLILLKLIGVFPFKCYVTSQRKLVYKKSIIGSITMFFNVITYFISNVWYSL